MHIVQRRGSELSKRLVTPEDAVVKHRSLASGATLRHGFRTNVNPAVPHPYWS
jgi:hypothetical protein